MGGTDGSFPGVGLHAAQALCEGTIAPGRACPIVKEIYVPGCRGSNTQVHRLVTP